MTINTGNTTEQAPLKGMSYYDPPVTAQLYARGGKVQIPYGGLAIPLLDEDFASLNGAEPSYDAIGRGIYHALRFNPDLPNGARYALLLQEGYPHLIAELASNLLMLEKKDVDVGYLERKINYLKIFALLEPDNHRFSLEIGATLLEAGMQLAALNRTTTILYRAEGYLQQAVEMKPDDVQARHQLGEVKFLLGKYPVAVESWAGIVTALPDEAQTTIRRRLQRIADGTLPRVPAVDYLQALGMAMEAFELEDYAEASAIIRDVLDDEVFFAEFPLAEICYLLGLCYAKLNIPGDAEHYFKQALALRSDYAEAQLALAELTGQGG
jgi:tetratricopeptide (TPR) repeat protein